MSLFLAFWMAAYPLSGSLLAQDAADGLHIEIIDGEGFTNNIKKRVARDPVVEVRDRNNKPVAGATVSFLLPSTGPSGSFANGSKLLTVLTNQNGRAIATALKPNQVAGAFKINITASLQGQTATTAITQTNAALATAGGIGGIGVGATVGIVGAAAAAATIGIVKAVGSGGKTVKISAGPPQLGQLP